MAAHNLYILHIQTHGLLRGQNLELGRDADTGGQTKYVLELAQAQAKSPQVQQVDIITRQITDPRVSVDYSQAIEPFAPKGRIVRLPFGPKRYLRKELLWPHLYTFADAILQYLAQQKRTPTWIQAHYADAGQVGSLLSRWLNVPLIFTGHSLGRIKLKKLLEQDWPLEEIEAQFNIQQRIDAEEMTLTHADWIVASTQQEVEEQYRVYDRYNPERKLVIPPGVDTDRFRFQPLGDRGMVLQQELSRFLRDPNKPQILCLCRPAPRKNVPALVRAFGEHPWLREKANLVLVLGSRQDINQMDRGSRQVFQEIFHLVDRYDLYGSVAYPKQHQADDVPEFYRLAAHSGGVFVNPALTEPFGLTILEAGSCGVPVVATHDGGPQEILKNCDFGQLVDVSRPANIATALATLLSDRALWQRYHCNGIEKVPQHYAWDQHVSTLFERMETVALPRRRAVSFVRSRKRLIDAKRLVVSDIDNTLLGDRQGLADLMAYLDQYRDHFAFGIATGRRLDSAQEVLKEWGVPSPNFWVTSVGSEIHYGTDAEPDISWENHINRNWNPQRIRAVMAQLPFLELQPEEDQTPFKVSFFVRDRHDTVLREVRQHLRQHRLRLKSIYSHQEFLDILPLAASKGDAIRHLSLRWRIPLKNILVAGDSGNDEEMLKGHNLGVVVGNYSPELEPLRSYERVYFAEGHYANGILEALKHYRFFEAIV